MIYLASASPRRAELLTQIGVGFTALSLDGHAVDETWARGELALDYVARLARAKARAGVAVARQHDLPPRPVLGADTAVVLGRRVLGKPADYADAAEAARDMLERLSGRTHRVLTAIAIDSSLLKRAPVQSAVSISKVTFRKLTRPEISAMVASGEPFDKAGAYAIQGRAAAFVSRIEGSYSGIMGLPLFETAALLARV